MPAVVHPLLARIEQRDLSAPAEPRAQGGGGDAAGHALTKRASRMSECGGNTAQARSSDL